MLAISSHVFFLGLMCIITWLLCLRYLPLCVMESSMQDQGM